MDTAHQTKEKLSIQIRWMIRKDMPAVLQIERDSFEYHWQEEDFLSCVRQRNCIGMVAETDILQETAPTEKEISRRAEEICQTRIKGRSWFATKSTKEQKINDWLQAERELQWRRGVVGFMIYELHKTKLHIINFAVSPTHRRLGIGAKMTEKLINKLTQQRRYEITLEVRETNLPAQKFFQKQGFRAVYVLRGHYHDFNEDAYVMKYQLDGTKSYIGTNKDLRVL